MFSLLERRNKTLKRINESLRKENEALKQELSLYDLDKLNEQFEMSKNALKYMVVFIGRKNLHEKRRNRPACNRKF